MRAIARQAAVGASAVTLAFLASGPSQASDINQVMQAAQSGQTVRVLAAPPKRMLAGGGDGTWTTVQSILDQAQRAQEVNARMLQSINSEGGKVENVRQFRYLPFVAMTVDAKAVDVAQKAVPDAQMWQDEVKSLSLAQSEPLIGAPGVWAQGRTGKGQIVAVVDTGVDAQHIFLQGKTVLEACFATPCPNGQNQMVGPGAAAPVHDHGTHVAGISAGVGPNFAGVARDAQILAINVFSRAPNGGVGAADSDILQALDYILQQKVDQNRPIASVNMSLGGNQKFATPCTDSPYELAGQLLQAAGVVVVAASGNEKSTTGISSPACAPSIVSVGAVDKQQNIANFSNSAPYLSILAPGVDINSSVWKQGDHQAFGGKSGTSMAAPHVAGAFAVLREANPGAKAADLITAMKNSGKIITDPRNGVKTHFLDLPGSLQVVSRGGSAPAPTPPAPPAPPPKAEAPPPAAPPAPPPQAGAPQPPPPAPPAPPPPPARQGGMRPVIE